MRELQECKKEIFWRSQQKLHRRRQAWKRVRLCGITLVLCVTVLVTLRSIGGVREPHSNGMSQNDVGTVTQTYWVHISGPGVQKQITDQELTQQLRRQLQALTDKGGPGMSLDGPADLGPTDSIPSAGYSIVIISHGAEERYTLNGNVLFCDQTGKSVELTDAERKSLKVLLGLMGQ